MANNRTFTTPIAASSNYSFNINAGVKSVTIYNDTTSTGVINVKGNTSCILNGNSVSSADIPLTAGDSIVVASDTPFELTITSGAGVTGKLILLL